MTATKAKKSKARRSQSKAGEKYAVNVYDQLNLGGPNTRQEIIKTMALRMSKEQARVAIQKAIKLGMVKYLSVHDGLIIGVLYLEGQNLDRAKEKALVEVEARKAAMAAALATRGEAAATEARQEECGSELPVQRSLTTRGTTLVTFGNRWDGGPRGKRERTSDGYASSLSSVYLV